MDAEQLFWNVNEFIKEQLAELSDDDCQNIIDTLEQDTDDTVLAFDLCTILESL